MIDKKDIPYSEIKRRERINKAIKCGQELYEIYKCFDGIETEELKNVFKEMESKLQDVRHKLVKDIIEGGIT